jgi:hypothetical protein
VWWRYKWNTPKTIPIVWKDRGKESDQASLHCSNGANLKFGRKEKGIDFASCREVHFCGGFFDELTETRWFWLG